MLSIPATRYFILGLCWLLTFWVGWENYFIGVSVLSYLTKLKGPNCLDARDLLVVSVCRHASGFTMFGPWSSKCQTCLHNSLYLHSSVILTSQMLQKPKDVLCCCCPQFVEDILIRPSHNTWNQYCILFMFFLLNNCKKLSNKFEIQAELADHFMQKKNCRQLESIVDYLLFENQIFWCSYGHVPVMVGHYK